MSAKDLISQGISPITSQSLVKEALEMMEDYKVNALPWVEGELFRALITQKELTQEVNPDNRIEMLQGIAYCIHTQAHIFDVLNLMAQNEYDLLPVITEKGQYVGVITRKTLLRQLATLCDAESPGAIIHLEMYQRDFMLSDLAHLAEQNNAHIINLFTYPDKDNDKLQIILKVDLEDAAYFLRSLERFNYRVIAHYHHDSMTDELIQQRLEELLYYIEM